MTIPLPISPYLRQSSRSVRLEKPLRRLRVDTGGHVLEFIICHSWVNMDSSVWPMVHRTSIHVVVETHLASGSDF